MEIPGKIKREATGSTRTASSHFCYWLLLLVIVFFFLLRFHLRTVPLERDEGEYAYAGQLILQGIPPYQLAYNMKLPGTYASYALILALFGQTPSGIHLGLALVNAATTVLIFWLGRRLFGLLGGFVAGASYALLSISPSVLGFAGHATHFVVLPAVAGTLLLLEAVESDRRRLLFWGGLLFGLAFVMKQPGVLFLLFGGSYLLVTKLKRPVNWRELSWDANIFALGGLLPFAVTCLVMLKTGLFHRFWFWTFSYAKQYASEASINNGVDNFLRMLPKVVDSAALIWALAAIGLIILLWDKRARAHALFVCSFLLFSFLAVCPDLYFREHYFILLLPAVSLLVGLAVSSATDSLVLRRSGILKAMPIFLFFGAFGFSLFQQRQVLFELDPFAVGQSIYGGGNPFPEALRIADYVRSHTSKDARIAVIGSEPEIYFYSERHSATGYIYMYPLAELHKYTRQMQREMIQEVQEARPEILIFVQVSGSWLMARDSDKSVLEWMQQYVREHYGMVGVADMALPTMYHWSEEPHNFHPTSPSAIYIFKRTGSP